MFAISLAVVILALLIVCGVTIPIEISRAQAIILLFSASLVAVFSAMMGTIHYQINKTHLRLNLAFFDILSGRIRLENILNIVIKNGNMYISYIWTGEDPVIAQIVIKPKYFEKMKDALMKANSKIVFYNEDEDKGDQSEE